MIKVLLFQWFPTGYFKMPVIWLLFFFFALCFSQHSLFCWCLLCLVPLSFSTISLPVLTCPLLGAHWVIIFLEGSNCLSTEPTNHQDNSPSFFPDAQKCVFFYFFFYRSLFFFPLAGIFCRYFGIQVRSIFFLNCKVLASSEGLHITYPEFDWLYE